MDAKGRLSVPQSLRSTLRGLEDLKDDDAESLVVTTGMDACLVAYPKSEWERFEKKLGKLSQFDPAVVRLRRIYVAGAAECTLDKHGRLLIPPMLREYAGLEKDVVWAGMVKTIEIWNKNAWQAQMSDAREDPSAVAKALSELGL